VVLNLGGNLSKGPVDNLDRIVYRQSTIDVIIAVTELDEVRTINIKEEHSIFSR